MSNLEQQMISELVSQLNITNYSLNSNGPNANDIFWDMHDLFDTEDIISELPPAKAGGFLL